MDFLLESEQWRPEPTLRGCVISQAKIANHFYKYISLGKKSRGIIIAIFPPCMKHPVITALQIKTQIFLSYSGSESLKNTLYIVLLARTMFVIVWVQSYFRTVARVTHHPPLNTHMKGRFDFNFTTSGHPGAHVHPPSLIFTGGKLISTGGTECTRLVAGSVNTVDTIWEIVSFTHD